MGDALADAFRSEIPCDPGSAVLLAAFARERPSRLGGDPEDSDADLVLRLRDPRFFGAFAEAVLGDRRVAPGLRTSVLEHVFDLLPLPRTEGDVIEVGTRAPPRLLVFAGRLAESRSLTVLHVMHLVYAVFLDRTLLSKVSRPTRTAVYQALLAQEDASETLRALYACLHLASVPEPEAAAVFRRTLRSRAIPAGVCRLLASAAAAEDGGRSILASMARHEGLLPGDLPDAEAPAVLANIPRLPARLSASGQRYLERRRGDR